MYGGLWKYCQWNHIKKNMSMSMSMNKNIDKNKRVQISEKDVEDDQTVLLSLPETPYPDDAYMELLEKMRI